MERKPGNFVDMGKQKWSRSEAILVFALFAINFFKIPMSKRKGEVIVRNC